MTKPARTALIVTDIDNTVFDWVTYYVRSFSALLREVEGVTGISYARLAAESQEVFTRHGSIEYPFLIQELPSVVAHYGDDIDLMLTEAVDRGRRVFMKTAEAHLRPYDSVVETLVKIRADYPDVPLVALTDAPRYVAMWKLNKLGLLPYFNAVYGLADPRIPTCERNGRVKVDPEILLKHLQQVNFGFKGRIRILPDDYEKPGTRGLKTVLMDYSLDEDPAHRQSVLWIGDNLRKDVGLGQRLGVRTAWAKYGVLTNEELYRELHLFSPVANVHKNASFAAGDKDAPQPACILDKFAAILAHI
ncbi:MAG: hypothetical protein RIQ81_1127 [Pseudomonadota bacterium]